jgi:hypothetical protein
MTGDTLVTGIRSIRVPTRGSSITTVDVEVEFAAGAEEFAGADSPVSDCAAVSWAAVTGPGLDAVTIVNLSARQIWRQGVCEMEGRLGYTSSATKQKPLENDR